MAIVTRQTHPAEIVRSGHRRPLWRALYKFVRTQPLGTAGAVVIVLMVLAAVFADFLAPYDAYEINQSLQFNPPSLTHWFGTDEFGRDVFTRMIYGARIALERYTVVFRLHYPSASFLSMLPHPANFIYAKEYLDQDINWYKTHTMGTGPFKLKEYVRGSTLEFTRNPDYWKQGLPYLDGAKYFIIKDTGERAKAIRAERVDVEFRSFAPVEVEAITGQMDDKVVVAHPGQPVNWSIAVNVDKKPFDDERVRQALSLALDRYDMAKTIGQLTGLDSVAGPMPPGTPWTLSPEELQALPGFGKDHQANLREARRLLADAGYPNGFHTVLTNRTVKLPYIDFGVYVVSEWKKIGVEAEHKLEESATWSKSRLTRDFELLVDPFGFAAEGDPDEIMVKFISNSPSNWGRFPVKDTTSPCRRPLPCTPSMPRIRSSTLPPISPGIPMRPAGLERRLPPCRRLGISSSFPIRWPSVPPTRCPQRRPSKKPSFSSSVSTGAMSKRARR
jgi:ABC-type transport system substrate-binding protein